MRVFIKRALLVSALGITAYFLVLNTFTGLRVQGYSYLFRASQPYDLVLKHVLIIDGTGENAPFRGDIAISNGEIAAIGVINAKKSPVFDAGGLTAIPVPIRIEKSPEVLEHLLATSYPRYPAADIFLNEAPYEGLSLEQAAATANLSVEEIFKRLVSSTERDSKVYLLKLREGKETKETREIEGTKEIGGAKAAKEERSSNEEMLARLTGYRAEALGLTESGLLRTGYRADIYLFKTADYSGMALRELFAGGTVPAPDHVIQAGIFL